MGCSGTVTIQSDEHTFLHFHLSDCIWVIAHLLWTDTEPHKFVSVYNLMYHTHTHKQSNLWFWFSEVNIKLKKILQCLGMRLQVMSSNRINSKTVKFPVQFSVCCQLQITYHCLLTDADNLCICHLCQQHNLRHHWYCALLHGSAKKRDRPARVAVSI